MEEQQRTAAEVQPQFRALCVDDNRDCADSLALLLEIMGFECRACYDGASAIALNNTFRPGLCFFDLNMPGMDGDELARRFLRQTDWQPYLLVAITAMSDEKSRARTTAAGFHMHMVKPLDPTQLGEVSEELFKAASKRLAGLSASMRQSVRHTCSVR